MSAFFNHLLDGLGGGLLADVALVALIFVVAAGEYLIVFYVTLHVLRRRRARQNRGSVAPSPQSGAALKPGG